MKEQISTKEQIRRYENFLGTVKKYIEEQEDEQIQHQIRVSASEIQTSNLFGRFRIIDGFIPVSI